VKVENIQGQKTESDCPRGASHLRKTLMSASMGVTIMTVVHSGTAL
jgi:hypothetical protein